MKKILVLLVNFIVTLAFEEFITGNNKFAASVYKVLSKNNKSNVLFSPFSAELILALAQSGAKDASAEELQNVLHLPKNTSLIESSIKNLLPDLLSNDYYRINTANKIYVKNTYPIKQDFQELAAQIYGADVENINFKYQLNAAYRINQWVEKQTEHKIKNLITSDALSNKTRLVLVNALHFKANWTIPFEFLSTRKSDFHSATGRMVQVDTMYLFDEVFKYYEDLNLRATFLEMPIDGDDISMTLALPLDKNGLAALEDRIEDVLAPHPYIEEIVNIALPKFKLSARIDLKEVLKQLGVSAVFEDGKADFTKIAGQKGDLFISDVVQKVFVNCDEDGIEAAAASYILKLFNRSGPVAKNFILDHPFLFYIKVKNIIVFVGKLVLPMY